MMRGRVSSRPSSSTDQDVLDWPTIRQLYVGGAFIEGYDIVLEMHETGELAEALGIHRTAAAS